MTTKLYDQWLQGVRQTLGQRLRQLESQTEERVKELTRRLDELRQPLLLEREISDLERRLAALTVERQSLAEQVAAAEADLRGDLEVLLSACASRLAAAAAAADRETLQEARRYLGAEALPDHEPTAALRQRLKALARPREDRASLAAARAAAAEQVAQAADRLRRRDELRQQEQQSRAALTRVQTELREEYNVPPEVLAALQLLVETKGDEAYHDHLKVRLTAAEAETSWQIPTDVLATLGLADARSS